MSLPTPKYHMCKTSIDILSSLKKSSRVIAGASLKGASLTPMVATQAARADRFVKFKAAAFGRVPLIALHLQQIYSVPGCRVRLKACLRNFQSPLTLIARNWNVFSVTGSQTPSRESWFNKWTTSDSRACKVLHSPHNQIPDKDTLRRSQKNKTCSPDN